MQILLKEDEVGFLLIVICPLVTLVNFLGD